MNRPYGDKRTLMLHSRHLSQRHTPSSLNNLFKRQQSAYKASRISMNDGFGIGNCSTGLLARRESGPTLMTQSNWNKVKTFEAWKQDSSTKQQTQIMKSNRKLKTSYYPRRSAEPFATKRNNFYKTEKDEQQCFKKLCKAFGIVSDF